ncbi:MAG TPA: homoserine O-acetyltransferase [Candidatus Lokiarchaeia archaeon]|nr:homoserine O-acetyltransferase [Candidatus Lokiarchaeia archaeon]
MEKEAYDETFETRGTNSYYSTFTFAEPPDELVLETGQRFGPITLAYETFGELGPEKDNAILVFHALSGDSHVSGEGGWWTSLIGPGKAIDTNKYFVISANVIGGCSGSTGPSSINPETGEYYAMDFPIITIHDMVSAQIHLLDYLGIPKLLAAIGGSMGGMQVLELAISYTDRVQAAIPVATTAELPPQGIAFDEVGRQAIIKDDTWQKYKGNYYGMGKGIPEKGLSIARMIGHITYLSKDSMKEKFGRRLQDKEAYDYNFDDAEFQVESYLRYQGNKFTERFDANSYLYITKAINYFDLSRRFGSLQAAFKDVTASFLVLSFTSDWLYPPELSKQIVTALQANGVSVTYLNIESNYGHDAFLLPNDAFEKAVRSFLKNQHEKFEVNENANNANSD